LAAGFEADFDAGFEAGFDAGAVPASDPQPTPRLTATSATAVDGMREKMLIPMGRSPSVRYRNTRSPNPPTRKTDLYHVPKMAA
jgi:hypothetical protein